MSFWKGIMSITHKSGIGFQKPVIPLYFRSLSTQRLIFSDYGDPVSAVRYEENAQFEVDNDQLIVKMLASPINPSDINTIQGTYPLKPAIFPAIGGQEGVGVVQRVGKGPNPHGLTEGSWVIPKRAGSGTWRSLVAADNDDYIPIPKMEVVSAATISVNPCTAYRLLKDFADLEPGDTVIQNGGNSGVGQAVIQLCREFGYKCISIVRNRENIADLKKQLEALGDANSSVLTDEEVRGKVRDIKAQLALNCTGGKVATEMLRTLESGCVMVTYGGMARQPVIVPTALLIFKQIAVQGFWMTRWNHTSPLNDRLDMLNHIAQLVNEGKFKPPNHKLMHISQYKEALQTAMSGYTNTKFVFTFD